MTDKTWRGKLEAVFDFGEAEKRVIEDLTLNGFAGTYGPIPVAKDYAALRAAVKPPLVENDPPREECTPPHTRDVFDPATFGAVVDWIVSVAKASGYQALAASGHSGLVPAAAACYRLGIPLLAVRKQDERPKGDSRSVNGVLPHGPVRFAIVDDFVASGETVVRIRREVVRRWPSAHLSALILYGCYQGSENSSRNDVERFSVWAEDSAPNEWARGLVIHARKEV